MMLDHFPTKVMANFLMLIWRAWHVRNSITQEGKWIPITAFIIFLTCYMNSLEASVGKRARGSADVQGSEGGKGRQTAQHWLPPGDGMVKVNVDGAFHPTTGKAGLGVIIRDHTGQPLLTAWRAIFHCRDAEEAEAQACLDGIRLASR